MRYIFFLFLGFILAIYFRDGKSAEIECDSISIIWAKSSIIRCAGYEITKNGQKIFLDADNVLYVDIKEKDK